MTNHIIIHGYLGRDPELKTYKNARGETRDLVNLSVGVSRVGDGTDWFRVTMFGSRAKVIEKFFSKGSQIIISGRMQNDTYKKDGRKMSSWKLIADDFDFCDSSTSARGQNNSAVTNSDDIPDSFEDAEEDIPF